MRTAEIKRATKETNIELKLNIDGSGKGDISTGIEYFDHMMNCFAAHSGFDISLRVKGDLGVDCHHTVEDTAIVLGAAIKQAAGDKKGIERFFDCTLPMDESLSFCALDFSGRSYLAYEAEFRRQFCGDYETAMTEEFFRALAMKSEVTLHLKSLCGTNDHHKTEGLYKAAARCFKKCLAITGSEVPSSKGSL